jgi:hypothetical protein
LPACPFEFSRFQYVVTPRPDVRKRGLAGESIKEMTDCRTFALIAPGRMT